MFFSLVRLLFATAIAVTLGFTWTVGQGGLKQTNSNLCDLWSSLLLPPYPNCEFQFVLPALWIVAFTVAVIWALVELYRLCRSHWRTRRAGRSQIENEPHVSETQQSGGRPIPITPASIYSFLNGYPIVRETDQSISQSLGFKADEEPCPVHGLANAAKYFRIRSLTELESLLREHQETILGLSRYFRLKRSGGKPAMIPRGHSVHMLFETLAARSGSVDKYMEYVNAFGAHCAPAFGQEVIDAYRELTASRLSRPNTRYEFEVAPVKLEGTPLAWATVPHLRWLARADGGRDIIAIAIEGKNVGDKEVRLESAHIVSGFTGARFEMNIQAVSGRNIGMVPIRKAGPVPPHAEINLLSIELNGQEGIEETQFQKYWGSVGFVVVFDGQEHRKNYDPKAIHDALEAERIDPPKPHVTVKYEG